MAASNPKLDAVTVAAFCLASVACCFAASWSLASHLAHRWRR